MDDSTINALQFQAILAVALPRALQWVKGNPKFKFMSYTSGRLNFWFTGLVASLTSFGIHFAFNANAGTLLITGLTIGGIWTGVQHAGLQWAAQHFFYKTTVAPAISGAAQAAERTHPDKILVEPLVSEKANEQGPAKDPPKG